jgi:hypothetical protein
MKRETAVAAAAIAITPQAAAFHGPTLSPSPTVGHGEPTPGLSCVSALQRWHRSRLCYCTVSLLFGPTDVS